MIWFTADWHLGESRMDMMQRPFADADEMFFCLRERHNAVVAPNDTVYVVGDVCNKNTPEWLPRVAEFNGRKILVRGNHDRGISDADFGRCFDAVFPEDGGVFVPFPEAGSHENPMLELYLTHYPSRALLGHFNLVGHIHSAWKFQLNMVNVGVDVHHFRPVGLDRIPFFREAVTKFYDDDVWAAHLLQNTFYRDVRGVKGSYFTKG